MWFVLFRFSLNLLLTQAFLWHYCNLTILKILQSSWWWLLYSSSSHHHGWLMAVHCGKSCTVGSCRPNVGVQRFYLLGTVWVGINTFYWSIFGFYKQDQVDITMSSCALCFLFATLTTRWCCLAENGLKHLQKVKLHIQNSEKKILQGFK